MDASEFKEYIIAMLFLKRVNDQFDVQREIRKKNLVEKRHLEDPAMIYSELEKSNAPEYDFFIPEAARWEKIKNLQEEIGDQLTIAFAALEDANLDKLEGVLKSINFNRTIGKNNKQITDEDLRELIREFNRIKLTDDNLEFPDLMGSAYEYLIKYFADSAGKKGGEFYTPNEVVRLMVNILEPSEDAEIYDPTVGSGGMLIESKNYVESRFGSSRNVSLYGQEKNGTTWSLCKMNMLFHNIYDSNIVNGDTLMNPLHKEHGELKTFDIVIANPPFSQNYSRDGMNSKERFNFWMPLKGKADFMFVQHMVASVNNAGRMAVVMPHGVLFRSGEERSFRQWLIEKGYLEAVISLPISLFYGTGIPASIIVINKNEAHIRDKVLIINADREYKEGKNQNKLRPEDIEKISYAYRHKMEIPKYSRLISKEELEAEEYNLSIRRYVDNSPPPEPHDVHAHLHGGIPVAEVENSDNFFKSYNGLKEKLFTALKPSYLQFTDRVTQKEDIKSIFDNGNEVPAAHSEYTDLIEEWWGNRLPQLKMLPETEITEYDLYRAFSVSLTESLSKLSILDEFKVRGSFAGYWSLLFTDIRSVSSSGWNAELIPDEEILQSQFPDVLKELSENEARRDEIESLFKEVNELEDGMWNEDDYEVWPKEELKARKDNLKLLRGERKEADKEYKNMLKRIKVEKQPEVLQSLKNESAGLKSQIEKLDAQIEAEEKRILKHSELEAELKECRRKVKEIKERKQLLVDTARERILPEEARELILSRWKRTMHQTIESYLQDYELQLLKAVENLWDKYTIPLKVILDEREKESLLLNNYLKELGYE